MRHIQGEDRHQKSLLPDSVEDFVDADNPIRVIDAYIGSLDVVSLGFDKAVPQSTGRKPYDPHDLLKLYVYGYLNRVTSSRRLETECHRNLEVIWLMRRLQPDFKTIADFRKDNGEAIRNACRSFIRFCRDANLLTAGVVAIDGSKFKSAASKDKMLTRKQLDRDRAKVLSDIEKYLSQLDSADDNQHQVQLERDGVPAILARLQAKADHLDEREAAMDTLGTNQHCASEPEARLMRSGRDGMIVGYNVQTAVDEKTGLIVHHDITDDTGDNRQLLPMAVNAQRELDAQKLDVLADAGYSNGEQQHDCEQQGITATVPRRVVPNSNLDFYQKADFQFDSENNEYHCPAGEVLTYAGDDKRRKLHVYQRAGCSRCPLQSSCTKSDKRSVTRHFYEDTFNRSEKRISADPSLMRRRMAIAERPFAILKRAMAMRRFHCWGMRGVKSEMAIGTLAYNLKLTINRIGARQMLQLLS